MKKLLVFSAVAILLACGAALAYLQLDKEPVFLEVRGIYSHSVAHPIRSTAAGATRRVTLINRAGREVTEIFIRRPVRLEREYRIWLTYAGAKTGERILDLVPDRPDVVLVSVQYPYRSPEGVAGHLRWPYDIRRAAFRSVAGGLLALDFLEQDEGLDIDRVVAVGISVGVPFATLLAALDERIPRVMLVHGGGDLAGQVRATQEPRWLAVPSSLLAKALFGTFEPLNYVHRISPREVVVIAARNESMLPKTAVEKLYAKAREPKRLIWTESDHVRSRNAETVERILRHIDRYMTADGNTGETL